MGSKIKVYRYKKPVSKHKNIKQFDLDGRLIAIYENFHHLKSALNYKDKQLPCIKACLKGHVRAYNGYFWSLSKKFAIKNDKNKRSIKKYSLDGKFIKEYSSLTEAQNDTKIKKSKISRAAYKKMGSSGGFRWQFSKEFLHPRSRVSLIKNKYKLINIMTNEEWISGTLTDLSSKSGIGFSSLVRIRHGIASSKLMSNYRFEFIKTATHFE